MQPDYKVASGRLIPTQQLTQGSSDHCTGSTRGTPAERGHQIQIMFLHRKAWPVNERLGQVDALKYYTQLPSWERENGQEHPHDKIEL